MCVVGPGAEEEFRLVLHAERHKSASSTLCPRECWVMTPVACCPCQNCRERDEHRKPQRLNRSPGAT
ncbi:hypothetical protein KOW79_020889 [Hemibagrus wyckioides]|uniref:Uncharacterized protein n=1 Tax=Hemibagrus wyckioides TaxID=337641 RepID=A0A9D3SDP1_9TELE|nr:hypothetical protein KOW79_020889 [Hemibagrus wyckioides]